MKLLAQPVKPFIVNQHFKENKACISLDGTRKVIVCDGTKPPAGYKSLYGAQGHSGIDLRSSHGQEVYASASGTVYMIDTNPKSGLDIRIESNDQGVRFRVIYEHLMGYQVKVGDKVTVGQLIGWADNTGYSSGNHLHLQMEIWSGTSNGSSWVLADPIPYMDNAFALDILALINKVKYLREVVAKLLDNLAYKLRK